MVGDARQRYAKPMYSRPEYANTPDQTGAELRGCLHLLATAGLVFGTTVTGRLALIVGNRVATQHRPTFEDGTLAAGYALAAVVFGRLVLWWTRRRRVIARRYLLFDAVLPPIATLVDIAAWNHWTRFAGIMAFAEVAGLILSALATTRWARWFHHDKSKLDFGLR
ncbi:hypothetical protein KGQ19_07465 [Catenulispora sp. NL8]|uniref:Integral membrane protein n=1 Tax=Catenulispora pinistramenti TaxID=2705254 RepID=A0ABS5KKZ0_9ACTN|nr:hypothetical protein [Catenulispora pinistramenti]MBS2546703.1 hypothetical protein [Catenulispora pinistramenti]